MDPVSLVAAFLGTLLVVILTTLAWLGNEERKRRAAQGSHEGGQPPREG